jgi:hypothetical protein
VTKHSVQKQRSCDETTKISISLLWKSLEFLFSGGEMMNKNPELTAVSIPQQNRRYFHMKVFQLNITVKKESNFSAITMSVEW